METHARYVLVGLFALAVLVIGFVFISWISAAGLSGQQTTYRVRFEGSVSGLRPGSAVVFNGLRVGQVSTLKIDPTAPSAVVATLTINADTPLRTDTRVGIEFQGLTGSPSVSLSGGQASAPPLVASPGEPPTLVADPALSRGLTETARDVLGKVGLVVDQNADALRETIANLNIFSGALARNSGRLDTIVAGLERLTGGSTNVPLPSFDLTAPTTFPPYARIPEAQLAVADPTALIAYDTRRILSSGSGGALMPLEGGQWSDNIPKLVQAKIVESFENAGYSRAGQGTDALSADLQLQIDIRRFEVSLTADPKAEVSLTAKIVTKDGEVRQSRTFQGAAPVGGTEAHAAVEGLTKAFASAATELVRWAFEAL